jgi:Tfp pilus assembly protein PilO
MALSLKDRTVRVALNIFGVAIFFVAAHLVAGEIIFKPLAKAHQRLSEVQKRLEDTQKLVHDYPDARTRTKEILTRMDALKEKSVSSKELPRIIQQLTKKTSELKIDIISIKPIEKPDFAEAGLPQGVSKAYIEVVVRAPYKVIGNYFKALKEMPILFTIEGVTLERSSGPESERDKENKKESAKDAGYAGEVIASMLISSYTVWRL